MVLVGLGFSVVGAVRCTSRDLKELAFNALGYHGLRDQVVAIVVDRRVGRSVQAMRHSRAPTHRFSALSVSSSL